MDEPRPGFFKFRRKLLVGYVVLCALITLLLVWKFFADYLSQRAANAVITKISAHTMAAHVAETVDAVDQSLKISARRISTLSEESLSPQTVAPLLAGSSNSSDSRYWLLFIDAAGRGVVANNNLPVRGVSFADRSYFHDAATTSGDGLHVGGPAVGHVSNRRVFFLSRRVASVSGKFLGVVAAPIDASRLANVFERARLGPAMSITLTTESGIVIARAPLFDLSFGNDIRGDTPLHQPVKSTTFESDRTFNGERQIFAYVPVGHLPLLVIVGVTQASFIEGVRSDLILGSIGLMIALMVALLSARFAFENYERLERVEAWQRKLIQQLANAKDEVARGERRLRLIADNVPGRIAYINADERYTFHNGGKHGTPSGAFMGRTLLETHGPEIYALLKSDIRRALAGEDVCVEKNYSVRGESRYFQHQYSPDVSANGLVLGFYAMVTDITEFKLIQQRLAAAARIDTLTGLPNRAELLTHLETALARCRRNGQSLACLYLDIDKFKDVNDSLGHAGGDATLIEFGRRLRFCVRECDLVARLAGDEFVIVLEALHFPAEAERVATKIIDSMSRPFKIEGTLRNVTTSVGMVIADPYNCDARALLRSADEALYRAKRAGRNRVEVQIRRNEKTDLQRS